MKKQSLYDVCIVGAGVAGASIAAALQDKNLSIALLDFDFEERDRIVGELLQPGGVYMLQQLGLAHVLDEIETSPIEGYALFHQGESYVLNYDLKGDFEGLQGRGLNNGQFIQALRAQTQHSQNVDQIVGEVLDVLEFEGQVEGVVYLDHNKEKQSLLARLTIVCDGFFSTLRKKLIQEEKKITSQFIGLVLEQCVLPYEAYGHIFMSGKAPFLCYRISQEQVRLLVDFPSAEALPKGAALQSYVYEAVQPHLPESMQNSFAVAIEKGNFKYMPNHRMSAKTCMKQGVVMLGDSLNMRHPLTGGGMTATLTDAVLLCKYLFTENDLVDEAQMENQKALYYEARNEWNTSINILADALYKVSLHPALKEACFQYLGKGEAYSQQPLQLLAGISRDNATLFKHFAQVALLGAKDNFSSSSAWLGLDSSFTLLKDAGQILLPLLAKQDLALKGFGGKKRIDRMMGVG